MTTPLFLSFVGSLVICMALIPPLVSSAGRFNVLDMPGERKLHAVPIARVGGIAFALAAFAALLLWGPRDQHVTAYLLGGVIILLFGVWDDRVGLTVPAKFAGQLVAAVIAVAYGHVRLTSLPLAFDLVLPEWAAVGLTIFVLLGVTNAINLADGLDGLAGGLAVLSFGAITYLAYVNGDTVVMFMMLSVLGGLLGFLRLNTYPARVFMGDGGSQFLGYVLGLSVLLTTDSSRGPYSPALGLLIIGLPLLDTLGVMIQRLAERRSPFQADNNHIHHKLLTLGLLQHEAVLVIYGLQAVMVGLACLLRWQSDVVLLGIYGTLALLVLGLFLVAKPGVSVRAGGHGLAGLRTLVLDRLDASETLRDMPIRVVRLSLVVFLLLGVALPREVPADFGWLALTLGAVLLAGWRFWPEGGAWLVRTALYTGSAFVLFLFEQTGGPVSWILQGVMNAWFAVLALLVILAVRFARGRNFETTPMDLLVVLLGLLLPSLPDMRVGETVVNLVISKLIVLFFAYEVLLSALAPRLRPILLLATWLLVGLGMRGVL